MDGGLSMAEKRPRKEKKGIVAKLLEMVKECCE